MPTKVVQWPITEWAETWYHDGYDDAEEEGGGGDGDLTPDLLWFQSMPEIRTPYSLKVQQIYLYWRSVLEPTWAG